MNEFNTGFDKILHEHSVCERDSAGYLGFVNSTLSPVQLLANMSKTFKQLSDQYAQGVAAMAERSSGSKTAKVKRNRIYQYWNLNDRNTPRRILIIKNYPIMQENIKEVIVVIGSGSIGQAIARRVSAGKQVLLADLRPENNEKAAKILSEAGFEVSTAVVDVSSRDSETRHLRRGHSTSKQRGPIRAAGVSPSQASPSTILKVDLYGTALVLEEFGNVIAPGGTGVVIASQSGHRLASLTPEQNKALAMTPTDELLSLPMLQPDQITDSLHAYQVSKRGNSLRVMAEAVRWGKRGARINTISPGIVITPLAKDELSGPRGDGYRRMIGLSAVGRAGTPDEVGAVGAIL